MNTTIAQNPTQAATNETTSSPSEVKRDFGAGRYSASMAEAYRDLKRVLKFKENLAFLVAKQFGDDVGQAMAQQTGAAKIKLGNKLSKEGQISIREILPAVKYTVKNSITLVKLCQHLDAGRQFGLEFTHASRYMLTKELNEWLEALEAKFEKK